MCSIVLTYDENNPAAQQQLATLLDSGLFVKQPYTAEDLMEHRDEIDAFFRASRISMSDVIARNV